ncbi:MAG: hypothetical protein IJ733_03630 [Lachnospiraceae bacterium]|nr:hypothetical protein [Lachnospiraceae bacterium]
MQMKFTCSDCGVEMKFDETKGSLRCPSCQRSEQIEGYEKDFVKFRHVKQLDEFGDEEARLYVCRSCGMQLMTNNRTALSTCYFCGGAMTIGERLSGDLMPTRIIPFSVTERQAKKAFSRWFLKVKFAPREFRKKKKECSCHAIYLPVWQFQFRGQGEAKLHATRSKEGVDEEDQEKIIETDHFDLYRRFDLGFDHIPMCASGKIEGRFLEALEPYDFSALKKFDLYTDFETAAERYGCKDDKLEKGAEKKVREAIDEYLLRTVSGYEETKVIEREYQVGKAGTEYIWLPVWFVSIEPADNEYLFVMNGQTGKVASYPPYAPVKILIAWGLLVTFSFLLIRIIILLLGGSLL